VHAILIHVTQILTNGNLKIMDARLDSSLATHPGAGTAGFDVFALLSPEEVCWIMDKTICAEVCPERPRRTVV
jgi:hypothetical protein